MPHPYFSSCFLTDKDQGKNAISPSATLHRRVARDNPKSLIAHPGSLIPNPESPIPNPESRIADPDP
jgi:hypothetical protein